MSAVQQPPGTSGNGAVAPAPSPRPIVEPPVLSTSDAVLGIALPAPATFLVGLALVLFGVIAALAMRAPAAAEAAAPAEAPRHAA